MEYALKAALETQKEKLIFIEESIKRILELLEPSNGTISPENFLEMSCPKCQVEFDINKELFLTVTEIQCPKCYHIFKIGENNANRRTNKTD